MRWSHGQIGADVVQSSDDVAGYGEGPYQWSAQWQAKIFEVNGKTTQWYEAWKVFE